MCANVGVPTGRPSMTRFVENMVSGDLGIGGEGGIGDGATMFCCL